jgi:hypothetical protein
MLAFALSFVINWPVFKFLVVMHSVRLAIFAIDLEDLLVATFTGFF